MGCIDECEAEAKGHPVWESPFLAACRSGQVARRDYQAFFSSYADHARGVDRLIATVLQNCDDLHQRAALGTAAWGNDWAVRRARDLEALLHTLDVRQTAQEAGAGLGLECQRLCRGPWPESLAALWWGVLWPASILHRALLPGLEKLGLSGEALAFVREDVVPLEGVVKRILESAGDQPERNKACRTAVAAALSAHQRFLGDAFSGMQRFGVAGILERIQQRDSLATEDAIFLQAAGAPGVPLYSNKLDKLNIQFSVESLPFRTEVLEPRLVRIPPHKNNERHRHAHETVFFIISGEGRIEVDEKYVPIRAGDIAFVPRWAMHQSQNTGDTEMRILAITDFGLTGKTYIGDYTNASRLVHTEQASAANWRVLRAESKATEDFLAPLSIAYGAEREIWPDPYALYDKARSAAPVYYSERFGAWFLTRYADVTEALRDRRLSSRRADEKFRGMDDDAQERMVAFRDGMRQWFSFQDPPDHTRVRARLNRFFSGRAAEALRPRMEAIVDELMSAKQSARHADIIWDIASPLHFGVTSELIFGQRSDLTLLKQWSMDIWSFVGSGAPTNERSERASTSWRDMTAWMREQVRRRRRENGDDIVSALFAPDENGDTLTEEEVTASCLLIFSIGHEATWDTVANCVLTMLDYPAAMKELRESPSLMVGAVDEFLRFESPVQFVARKAAEPLSLGGKQIEKDDFIFLMIGAANRDPEEYPDPGRLDLHRNATKNLATGGGIHHCIGGPLGKTETQVVLSKILKRWPEVRLTGEKLEWKRSLGSRGVHTLPVVF